jgi:hypothetical protein
LNFENGRNGRQALIATPKLVFSLSFSSGKKTFCRDDLTKIVFDNDFHSCSLSSLQLCCGFPGEKYTSYLAINGDDGWKLKVLTIYATTPQPVNGLVGDVGKKACFFF